MIIEILAGMDAHVHWRNGDMRDLVVPHTARQFEYALWMPNTRPEPITTAGGLTVYGKQADAIAAEAGCGPFASVGTIQFTRKTTVEMIGGLVAAKHFGVKVGGVKVYFEGTTTNSDNGITIRELLEEKDDVLAYMEQEEIPLLVHLENVAEPDHQKREALALFVFEELILRFPNLKISFEHISTKVGVELVERLPDNVVATITDHHPVLTWDDVGVTPDGHVHHPHCLCMPVVKTPEDRDAVLGAMVSGNPKFFFGSDSAPHPMGEKEDPARRWPQKPPNFGVYSADVATEFMAGIFERHAGSDWVAKMNAFRGVFGPRFYRLPPCARTLRLERRVHRVSGDYGLVRSFWAGRELEWKLID